MPKGRHRKSPQHHRAARTSARVAGVVGAGAVLAATATTPAGAVTPASGSPSTGTPTTGLPAGAPQAASAPQSAAQTNSPGRTYTVRSGDTLSRIARQHGVSWQKLCAANGIRDCDRIYPGQTLTIGGGGGNGGDAQQDARAAAQDRPSRAKRGGGVDLPAAASCIRRYESGHDYRAENPVSSASGAYQFIDSTWTAVTGLAPPASKYGKKTQDRAFVELWDNGRGAHHWVTAPKCGY